MSQADIIDKLVAPMPGNFDARLRTGPVISVDPRDYNGRVVALFGAIEPAVTALCQHLLQKGDCFLDVGANYGAVGLNCLEAVGPSGRIHLFEPQGKLCDAITDCIEQFELRSVKLHRVALLDTDSEMDMHAPAGHSGRASLIRQADDAESFRVSVKDCRTFIPELLNGRSFGAKVDVEGGEDRIIPNLIDLPGFRFVIFEANSGVARQWVWSNCRDKHTRLYGIPKMLLRTRVVRIQTLEELDEFQDLLLLPRSESIPLPTW